MHNMSTCYEAHAELKQKPLLLSHMHEMGVFMAYFISQYSKQALACVQSHQSLHCSRTCAKWAYIRLLCVQSCQSLHCSRTCTKWAYINSVNAQTRLNMHTVLPEPSLLSHIHKMGVFMAYFISKCSNKP